MTELSEAAKASLQRGLEQARRMEFVDAPPTLGRKATPDELLMAGILRHGKEGLAPHHVAALKERLGHLSTPELDGLIFTGEFVIAPPHPSN